MATNRGEVSIKSAQILRGHNVVLTDVDLRINAGEIHALIGPNGAGKSTLLAALSGDVASDEIYISGTDIKSSTIEERAQRRSVVRSNFRPQFGYAVSDVVSWSGNSSDVNAVLTKLNIAHLAGRPITQLSSGQLARVNLACALLQQSDVIIADEPEAALDPQARVDVWSELVSTGQTIIIATHALDLVMKFATHVTAIHSGKIKFTKKMSDTTDAELHSLFISQ